MSESKEHILPVKTYIAVAGALFVLTVITVAISYIDLGGWNAVVAVGVATCKVSLVALFFMHLKYDSKIYLFSFIIGVLFVAVFIIFTMFDTLRRADLYQLKAEPINKDAVIYNESNADSSSVERPHE